MNAVVPARLASDPETLRKARFAVSVALCSCSFSAVMAFKYSSEGAFHIRNLILFHMLFFPVTLLVMRTTGFYRAVGHMCCERAPRGAHRADRGLRRGCLPLRDRERRMLAAITSEKARVEDAHRDLRVLLDSTGQGFVSLDPGGRVIGERSAVVDGWFGKPRGHEPFHAYLERCDESFGVMFELGWKALVDGVLPFDLCVGQLPRRMTHEGITFSFEYRSVLGGNGEMVKTVVIISDVTAQLANEAAEMRQRDLLAAFTGIRKDQDGFARFLEQAHVRISPGASRS